MEINEDKPNKNSKGYSELILVRERVLSLCVGRDSEEAEEWKSFIEEKRKAGSLGKLPVGSLEVGHPM